ncbi:CAP domain-containing protein [Thiofilum flexile]|uniref:CAP domain-containing protein n=1 Tax=Thiofilum flexile TaxID=125627 RepID=UPI00037E38D3|nr:CAP domain-containing protein [Thiofilum flexile]
MRYKLLGILLLILAGCSTKPPPTTVPSTTMPESTKSWFQLMTASHNRVRAQLGLQPLLWSNRLAGYAQEWADHLASTSCTMIHRVEAGRNPANYGENLFWSSPLIWEDGRREIARVSAARVVRDWAAEVKFYNYAADTCTPGEQCGHYTQLVWRNTRELGCGMAYCPNRGQIWVCSYNPPGNWIGERPY